MTTEERFKILEASLSIRGELMHPRHLLARAAERWPQRLALICGDEQISFAELDQEATVYAWHLKQHGIEPGDRIFIMCENSITFYKAYHGSWRTGAIVAPLNVFLSTAELAHIINDAQPKLILVSEKQREKVVPVAGDIPVLTITELCNSEQKVVPRQQSSTPSSIHDCSVLLYTSGTTGLPKGVMLSGHGLLTNCLQLIAEFEITSEERIFAPLPLFHSYMQNVAVWSPLVLGATTIVIPTINRTALLQGLSYQPTVVVGIPQLFGLFCLMPKIYFERVRLFASGGDALPDKIRLGFELLFGRRIANGYGMTETAPLISVFIDDVRSPTANIGKPLYGIKVAIRDAEGKPVSPGHIGTLWVAGKNVMLGYYGAPEATKNVLRDGWLDTGDLGFFDKDGYIIFSGRAKDIIVSKGIKIYPPEVENVLMMHDEVTMAAVVGLPIENDELVIAFVAASHPSDELVDELRNLCQQNLAPYKVPSRFIVRKSLPVTATGKVDKKILRQEVRNEILK